MVKIKKILLIGASLSLLSTSIKANNELFTTRGLYGGIQYIYLDNYYEINKKSSKSYLQIYQMGYEGSLYSPRLLTYDVSGTLYFDKTKRSNGEDLSIDDQSFKAYLNLIQGSKYPFTLFVEKQSLPTINLISDYVYSKQDLYRYGLYGSMKFGKYMLSYDARYRDSEVKGVFSDEKVKGSSYSLTLSRSFEKHFLSLYLRRNDTNYYRKSFTDESETDRDDKTSDARVTYNYNPSRTFRLNSYVGYSDIEYYDMKRITSNATFYWTPDDLYSLSFGVIGENLKYSNSFSNFTSIFANGRYKISSNLLSTQSIQFYNSTSSNYEQNTGSVNLGLRYSGNFNKSLSYYISGNTGLSVERGSGEEGIDETILDRNTQSINIGFGTTKRFIASGNLLGFSAYYNKFTSDLGEENDRYTLSSNFMTRIRNNLLYSINATYSDGESIGIKYRDDERVVKTKTTLLTVTNKLQYNTNIGINGRFSATTGLTYVYSNLGNSSGFRPYVNLTFYYRLRRNLIFSSVANVSRDTYGDVTNYSNFNGLEYAIRKIRFSAGARFSNSISDNRKGQQRRNIYLKFERVF